MDNKQTKIVLLSHSK